MKQIWLIGAAIAGLIILGGGIWLYSWDIPAPQDHVEQELSDDFVSR